MVTLLITYNFPPQVGGIETLMYDVVRNFPGRVLVLAPWTPGCEEFDRRQAFTIIRVKSPANTLIRTTAFVIKGIGVVRRERPGHMQSGNMFAGLAALGLHWIFRTPFSVYALGKEVLILNTDLRTGAYKAAFKKVFDQACRVLSISRYTTDELVKFGIPADKVHRIPSGIDTTKFDGFSDSEFARFEERFREFRGKKILLTIARLVPRKGHDQVIRSLSAVIREIPDVVYLIAGSGPEMERLKRLTTELGLDSHVRFLGRVPDGDLLYLYRLAHVFIMASRLLPDSADVEGFGQVFLEANYCGLPVIGGRSGGIPDSVEDGKTGFLVDPEDTADIADKVIRLMSDPQLCRQFAEYGKERVKRDFGHQGTVQSILRGLEACS